MSRETINLICSELPGAEKSSDGGQDVWSIGEASFAVVDAATTGVSVRRGDPKRAGALIAAGTARDAPGLDGAWLHLPFGMPEAEMRDWIVESYEAVRDTLPKAIQITLDRTSG